MTSALVPLTVRVEMAHAAVQRLADLAHVDVLHIKGPAVHPSLRGRTRVSSDVDVLVRPEGVQRLMALLAAHGWSSETSFDSGSAFDHAANLYHPSWGLLDVHRHYPGMEADAAGAFEVLWEGRGTALLAHLPCAVPEPLAQSLVLLLHSARSPGAGPSHPDVGPNWADRNEADRRRIAVLADRTGASIGLAAATGRLGDYAGRPDAALWEVFVHGGDRLDEWEARFRAARGARAKSWVAARSLGVNHYYLGQRLGHPPSRSEVAAEFFRRFGVAARQLAHRGGWR